VDVGLPKASNWRVAVVDCDEFVSTEYVPSRSAQSNVLDEPLLRETPGVKVEEPSVRSGAVALANYAS